MRVVKLLHNVHDLINCLNWKYETFVRLSCTERIEDNSENSTEEYKDEGF
jgi:hypothetical protein